MADVKVLRLNTGETIIGEITETKTLDDSDRTSSYTVRKGMQLIQTEPGKFGLIPWMPFIDSDEIRLSAESVMLFDDPIQDLSNGYRQMVAQASGLVTAPAGADQMIGSDEMTGGSLKLEDYD